jgi:hypothetical protein
LDQKRGAPPHRRGNGTTANDQPPQGFFFAVKSLNQETYHSPGGFRHVPAEAGSESLGFHGDLLGFKQEMVIFHGIFHGI